MRDLAGLHAGLGLEARGTRHESVVRVGRTTGR
ncbi:MAG: hypothetical protein ACI9OJ_003534, partial [Myxococcota bacterium]